jgi:hypothetical protein
MLFALIAACLILLFILSQHEMFPQLQKLKKQLGGGEHTGLLVNYYNSDKNGIKGPHLKQEVYKGPIDFNWKGGQVLNSGLKDNVRLDFTGFLIVPAGTWYFRTRSDDGVRLHIGGKRVIDQWKLQGPTYAQSEGVEIGAKATPFRLEWYEHNGGATLKLEAKYMSPMIDEAIRSEVLSRSPWSVLPQTAFLTQPPKPKEPVEEEKEEKEEKEEIIVPPPKWGGPVGSEPESNIEETVVEQERKVKKNKVKLENINRKLDVKDELTEGEHEMVQKAAVKNKDVAKLVEEAEQVLKVKEEKIEEQAEELQQDEELARQFKATAQSAEQEDETILRLTKQISSTKTLVNTHGSRLSSLSVQLKQLRANIDMNNALLVSIKGKLENSVKTTGYASTKSSQEEQIKVAQVAATSTAIKNNCPICPMYAKAPVNVWTGYGDMVKKTW